MLAHAPISSLRRFWFAVPVIALVAAALLANLGLDPTPRAVGATTDTVTVTATVGSALDMADGCAGAIAITVTMGGYNDGNVCPITFGATNDTSVNLRASSPAGNLFASNFADEGGTCANLGTVDEAGLKVVAVTAPTTNTWGCALGADNDNTTTAHKGVPNVATNVCLSAALGTANTCTLGVGIWEQGSDATAGTYNGAQSQLDLSVIG